VNSILPSLRYRTKRNLFGGAIYAVILSFIVVALASMQRSLF
jgi:hypothetical protein